MIALLDVAVRAAVVLAVVFATIVAVTSWAIRTKRLNPFGAWARFARRLSDPLLRPIERRVVRSGGSPHDAPLWLVGLALGGGLILLGITRWLVNKVAQFEYLAGAGPRAWLYTLVSLGFSLTMAALFIRVIGSWLGVSRYRPWMRPVYLITDWIVEPIRRVLPPMGMFDFSPMVAYLVLLLLRGFVLGLL